MAQFVCVGADHTRDAFLSAALIPPDVLRHGRVVHALDVLHLVKGSNA